MDKQPIATRQPKATEWKQGSEPLRPSAEMVHYAHADDLPTEFMADNFDKLANLVGRYMGKGGLRPGRAGVLLCRREALCTEAPQRRGVHQSSRRGRDNPGGTQDGLRVVCAALLHDTVEDTTTSLDDVTTYFGETVAELVDGVTKLTNIDVDTMDEKQALNLRKMFLAMSRDIRVVIVKLADRLHNMRTLAALREDRRLFKARETMDVYAPLADRLGMSSIKWELEDLSFFYLEPEAYQRIARMVSESREVRERFWPRLSSAR